MEINWYIIILIIVIVIVILVMVLIFTSPKQDTDKKEGKLVQFSGLFKQVSGLNIGHSNGAPIFHAHPWFGKGFGSGIGEYLGALKLNEDESLYLQIPRYSSTTDLNSSYEVNVFAYPSWEQLGETLYCPRNVSIGSSNMNDIIVDSDQEIIVIITGFSVLPNSVVINTQKWLSQCKIFIAESPVIYRDINGHPNEMRKNSSMKLPDISDDKYFDLILEKYNQFIDSFLQLNEGYVVAQDIVSQQGGGISFPPTNGVVESITYLPSSVDEVLILIFPNRKVTLGVQHAAYIEVTGERFYLEGTKEIADIYTYNIDKLDQIYIEERFLVSPNNKTLPFYAFIISRV